METQERKTIDNMSPTEWIQTVMVLPYIWDHLYFTLHTSASPSGRFFFKQKVFYMPFKPHKLLCTKTLLGSTLIAVQLIF